MSNQETIRAWKDKDFRLSLSDAERATLPQNPAGLIDVSDAELGVASGGLIHTFIACSLFCVPTWICTGAPHCRPR